MGWKDWYHAGGGERGGMILLKILRIFRNKLLTLGKCADFEAVVIPEWKEGKAEKRYQAEKEEEEKRGRRGER